MSWTTSLLADIKTFVRGRNGPQAFLADIKTSVTDRNGPQALPADKTSVTGKNVNIAQT